METEDGSFELSDTLQGCDFQVTLTEDIFNDSVEAVAGRYKMTGCRKGSVSPTQCHAHSLLFSHLLRSRSLTLILALHLRLSQWLAGTHTLFARQRAMEKVCLPALYCLNSVLLSLEKKQDGITGTPRPF